MRDTLDRLTDRADEVTDHGRERAHEWQRRLPPSIQRLITEARESDVLLFAGGLAFYGLISIAPFIVISFWIAGGIAGEDRLQELGENIEEMAPGGADVSGFFDSMAEIGTGVGLIALASALWPATAYGSGLVQAFDRISHRPDRSAQGLRGRLKALLFVAILPLFLVAGIGVSYVVSGLFENGAIVVLGWLVALVAAFTAGLVIIGVTYQIFGPESLPVRATIEGAAAASAAIAVMSLGYVIYLGQEADFEERVAGSGFAAVVLLALWLYLANIIVLVGYSLARSCAGLTDGEEGGGASSEDHEREPEPAG